MSWLPGPDGNQFRVCTRGSAYKIFRNVHCQGRRKPSTMASRNYANSIFFFFQIKITKDIFGHCPGFWIKLYIHSQNMYPEFSHVVLLWHTTRDRSEESMDTPLLWRTSRSSSYWNEFVYIILRQQSCSVTLYSVYAVRLNGTRQNNNRFLTMFSARHR